MARGFCIIRFLVEREGRLRFQMACYEFGEAIDAGLYVRLTLVGSACPVRAISGNDPSCGIGIKACEGFKIPWVGGGGAPFALDRNGRAFARCPYKIDFVSLLVAPVVNFLVREFKMERVQNNMFPERAHIV